MNAVVKAVAVIAGAQVAKIGIFYLISKAAEREENRLRMAEIHRNFDAMKPKND